MPDDDPLPAPIDVGAQVRDQIVYLAVPVRRADATDVERAASADGLAQARDSGVGGARRHVELRRRRPARSRRPAHAVLFASEVTQAYACIPLAI